MGGRGRSENGRKGFKDVNRPESTKGLNKTKNTKLTKAVEDAFRKTYNIAKLATDDKSAVPPLFGSEHGAIKENEYKAFQAKLTAEYEQLKTDFNLGIIKKKEFTLKTYALNAMQRGLNTDYNAQKLFGSKTIEHTDTFKNGATPRNIHPKWEFEVEKVSASGKSSNYGILSGDDLKSVLKGYHYNGLYWTKKGTKTFYMLKRKRR